MEKILVAKTETGNTIFLQGLYSRNELLLMRDIQQFFCPDCGSRMLLKLGDIKIPHFAHKSLTACFAHEPESSLHIKGKLLLYQFFKDKGIAVEIEKYLPSIRQRADLLINGQTAIEFQCSPISAADISKRSSAYSSLGLNFVWIGVSPKITTKGIQIVKLMEYQKGMLLAHHYSKYMILLNPETENFYYFSNLFYLSGNRWIGKSGILPAKKQTFPFAVPKILQKREFETVCTIFSNARAQYIKSQYFAKKRYQNPFWLLCYKLQLDLKNIPETIGVPILGAECFIDHPVIWQLKISLAIKEGLVIEDILSTNELQIQSNFSVKQARLVLESYLNFIQDTMALNEVSDKYSEVLYGIYCNSTEELRK